MCKLNAQMEKGGHYDVQMKGWRNRGQYDVQIKRLDGYGTDGCGKGRGIMMCKLNLWMEKGGHERGGCNRWAI